MTLPLPDTPPPPVPLSNPDADAHIAPIFFASRGIGTDYNLFCLATGTGPYTALPNLSAFVRSYEEGVRAVKLLGGRARLDHRATEPDWIQVKVGVLPAYSDVLSRLHEGTQALDGILTPYVLTWALSPTDAPGYEPPAIRRTREAKQWKDALLDELNSRNLFKPIPHLDNPRQALHDLLAWEVATALDPRVSREARTLRDTSLPFPLSSLSTLIGSLDVASSRVEALSYFLENGRCQSRDPSASICEGRCPTCKETP